VRPVVAETTSSALTQGIRVRVQSQYLADQSSPRDDRYVFAYTITIANEGMRTAQLRTRHWVITDARGSIEEVRGDGVVGEQP
jgi:ApaG protein